MTIREKLALMETMKAQNDQRWRDLLPQVKPGTVFRGNVNGAVMKCESIEKTLRGSHGAVLVDCKTGNKHHYGLDALQRCDITILEE